MNLGTHILRVLATVALALNVTATSANPVTLRLHGQIIGYEYIDLGASIGLTLGTQVDLTLSFNETWSDSTYSFSDPIGPVSGSATVGTHAFSFDGGVPYSYQYQQQSGLVDWVNPFFTGTGPSLGGGDFYGLFAVITPAMTLNSVYLGYAFTTPYPNGVTVTSYGYASISLDDYSITPGGPNRLPSPATLPLALLALVSAAAVRRRG